LAAERRTDDTDSMNRLLQIAPQGFQMRLPCHAAVQLKGSILRLTQLSDCQTILFRRQANKPVKPPATSSKLDGSGTDGLIVRCAGRKVKVPKLVNGTPKPETSVPPHGER